MIDPDRCFKVLRESPHAPRLVMFPYSGAGAYSMHRWLSHFPAGIELCAMQRAGREDRIAECPVRSLRDEIEECADALQSRFDRPYSLFGHSLGGFLAYQTAALISERGWRRPERLFISAISPSVVPEARATARQIFDRSVLARFDPDPTPASMPDENMAEFLSMAKAAYESDLSLYFDSAADAIWPVLDTPIVAFYGSHDSFASGPSVLAWRRFTSAAFESIEIAGDHMFVDTSGVSRVAGEIARHMLSFRHDEF